MHTNFIKWIPIRNSYIFMSNETEEKENINEELNESSQNEKTVEETDKKSKKKSKKKEAPKKEKEPAEIIAELKDTVLRTRADFDNFRKRTQRDIADARAYGKISALEELLPIFDTFKMAMMAANMDNADLNTLLAGMNMIENQFTQSFGALGIDELNGVGEKFDPNLHDAVSEEFSEEVEAGTIISQHRCGYKMGERLIRAATVIVSKGPEAKEADEES